MDKLFVLVLVLVQVAYSLSGCPFAPKKHLAEESRNLKDGFSCSAPPASCASVSTKYRTFDGSCNNLANPGWGMLDGRYGRLLAPNYADKISKVPLAKSGKDLPNPRKISLAIFANNTVTDPTLTLLCMQFGQFLAHDMSEVKNTSRTAIIDCCSAAAKASKNPRCYPMSVEASDPLYGPAGVTCLNFTRTLTDFDLNCPGKGSFAEQINEVNPWIDLSVVYGNTDDTIKSLRSFSGGLLSSEVKNNQEWLPRHPNALAVCRIQSVNESCYHGGDNRANQHAQLAVLQVLFVREHNRLAKALATLNPTWNDEKLFQEARKINIAKFQAVTYNEWLPNILGQNIVSKSKISFGSKATTFVNDYDATVNPSILNEHAQAAFRFFHSTIAGYLNLVGEDRSTHGALRLTDWVARPGILEQGTNFDDLSRGLASQPEREASELVTDEITQFWFRRQNVVWGQDLKANDIQRARDNGLATYNAARVRCGLKQATTFDQFADVMTPKNAQRLAQLYEHPDDVDLTVGGALETIQPGTLAGPTYLCILKEQFHRSRVADRFFFERTGDAGFALNQLLEIRKATFARLLCDNSQTIKKIQPNAFKQVSPKNALVDCTAIPSVNLALWKE